MKEQDMLAERINNLCREKKMSYFSLACASDVPIGTIMHIVDKSTVNPGMLTIERLCGGFGITLNEFFDSPEFIS